MGIEKSFKDTVEVDVIKRFISTLVVLIVIGFLFETATLKVYGRDLSFSDTDNVDIYLVTVEPRYEVHSK